MTAEELESAIENYLARAQAIGMAAAELAALESLQEEMQGYLQLAKSHRNELMASGKYYLLLGKVSRVQTAIERAKGGRPRNNKRWAFNLPHVPERTEKVRRPAGQSAGGGWPWKHSTGLNG